MYFQTLDDKTECVGVYKDGRLHFDEIPSGLLRTWRAGGSISDSAIEYAWVFCGGKSLKEACPPDLLEEYEASIRKMSAFYKSFKIAKVNFDDHCIFDLIPHDSLVKFCEIKNKITEHVFENFEKPINYEFIRDIHRLTAKISSQSLNVDASDCKELFVTTQNRLGINKILQLRKHIDYNMYGTVTGRLTTNRDSFPILTMKKEFRKILKPTNDWFVSLDYNGAEVRTLLSLTGEKQPKIDIHEWNALNLFEQEISREECKTRFFAWLYDPSSDIISTKLYDKNVALEKWYDGEIIKTPFDREIQVEERKALNYLIQSTTSDLVLERAVAIDKFLEDKKSFISHIVHDELVLDISDDERQLIPDIKLMFSENKLDTYMVNVQAGKNYYDLGDLNI